MFSSIAASVRITARKSAVWRTCACCDVLAPLSPSEDRCRECQAGPTSRRAKSAVRPCGRN